MGKHSKLRADVVERNLRRLVGKKNVTYSAFAREVGIGPCALDQILSGISKPSLATLLKIANTQNVSLDWLCTDHGKS
jgi:transcriptional regulator with XRE-family HTH domain